jgi:hypothetical protein
MNPFYIRIIYRIFPAVASFLLLIGPAARILSKCAFNPNVAANMANAKAGQLLSCSDHAMIEIMDLWPDRVIFLFVTLAGWAACRKQVEKFTGLLEEKQRKKNSTIQEGVIDVDATGDTIKAPNTTGPESEEYHQETTTHQDDTTDDEGADTQEMIRRATAGPQDMDKAYFLDDNVEHSLPNAQQALLSERVVDSAASLSPEKSEDDMFGVVLESGPGSQAPAKEETTAKTPPLKAHVRQGGRIPTDLDHDTDENKRYFSDVARHSGPKYESDNQDKTADFGMRAKAKADAAIKNKKATARIGTAHKVDLSDDKKKTKSTSRNKASYFGSAHVQNSYKGIKSPQNESDGKGQSETIGTAFGASGRASGAEKSGKGSSNTASTVAFGTTAQNSSTGKSASPKGSTQSKRGGKPGGTSGGKPSGGSFF